MEVRLEASKRRAGGPAQPEEHGGWRSASNGSGPSGWGSVESAAYSGTTSLKPLAKQRLAMAV